MVAGGRRARSQRSSEARSKAPSPTWCTALGPTAIQPAVPRHAVRTRSLRKPRTPPRGRAAREGRRRAARRAARGRRVRLPPKAHDRASARPLAGRGVSCAHACQCTRRTCVCKRPVPRIVLTGCCGRCQKPLPLYNRTSHLRASQRPYPQRTCARLPRNRAPSRANHKPRHRPPRRASSGHGVRRCQPRLPCRTLATLGKVAIALGNLGVTSHAAPPCTHAGGSSNMRVHACGKPAAPCKVLVEL